MSDSERTQSAPRAVIHQRILDEAEARPEASINALADAIAGASPALVERVLTRYSTAAQADTTQPDEHAEPSDPTMSETDISWEDLSAGQRDVLRAIKRRPDATQAELAEELDVSPATISTRVQEIDGFEWSDRATRITEIATDLEASAETAVASDGGTAADEIAARLAALEEQVTELEARLEADAERSDPPGPLEDPDLVAKLVRACVADDAITEEEKLAIIRAYLER